MKRTNVLGLLAITAAGLAFSVAAAPAPQDKPQDDYRAVVWGMNGETGWTSLLKATPFENLKKGGEWARDGEALTGTGAEKGAWLAFGEADWKDYELDFYVTPVTGGNVQVLVRASEDGSRAYLLDLLLGWQAAAISRRDGSLEKCDVVDFRIERGREYHVRLCVRGSSITSYIDGRLVNRLTDHSFKSGLAVLNCWQAQTRFRNVRYRRLA